jgi:signal transduction histidine kinase
LAAGASFAAGAPPSSATPIRHVLILHGGDLFEPSVVEQDQAVRAALREQWGSGVEFSSETLDSLRSSQTISHSRPTGTARGEQPRNSPDLIIAVRGSALEFVRRHRAQMWPGIPVVFSGVPEEDVSLKPEPGIAGVPMRFDMAGTIQLALELRPDTRDVVIISGTSDFDQDWLGRAERQLRDLRQGVAVRQISNLSVPQMLESVRELSPDSVILFTSVFNDSSGQRYLPRDVLEQLAKATRVPIFSMFDTYLGHGILGGSISSWDEQGRLAGALGARILEGKQPEDATLPPTPVPACMVDARELVRWSIAVNRLPPGCDVRFRTPTFWEANRATIIASIAAGVLICLSLVALLIQGRRRHRVELELSHQRSELMHAARLAMVGELTAGIAHEINQPLGAILSNADTAELLLDRGDPAQLDEVRQILADIRRDDLRASEVIRHLRALLRKRELELQPLDINRTISDVARLLSENARRRDIDFTTELEMSLPLVAADRVHMEQVLLNLLLNAMDAMAGKPAGERRLQVTTRMTNDRHVEVAIADSGVGITPQLRTHLFDSFYSTKEDGLGLGLSIARSIITAHEGRIWAENNLHGGATFRFALPVTGTVELVLPERLPQASSVRAAI